MRLINYDLLKPKPPNIENEYIISDNNEIILEDVENPKPQDETLQVASMLEILKECEELV